MNKHLRYFFLIICLLFQKPNILAQTYYVSSTIGSNKNDGLSEMTPKCDLSDVPKKDVTIRLKCGDVFWGGIKGYTNCIIESYGQGPRPVLCGFKVLKNLEAWKSAGSDLWILDLSNGKDFVGNIGNESNATINNIGFIYNPKLDKLYGRNVSELDSLKNEMDFFTSIFYSYEDVEKHPFKTVILKCEKNPAFLGNLCFPMSQHGIDQMSNCCIRGIAVVGFSKMGMVHFKECLVEDCQIDMIGGAIFLGNTRRSRYGNGIEFWYQYIDNTVTNCLISRTYDCATTIQANGIIQSNPRNIHFIRNRIYKCRQAFEHFINPSDKTLLQYENCDFSGNICCLMGDNDFNCPEPRDCNILSYEEDEKPITINNNVFWGANHLDGTISSADMGRNTVYLYTDQYLYTRHWHKDKRTIKSDEEGAINRYRKVTGDKSKIIVLKRGSKKALRLEKKIKKKIAWKPVELHLERII